jgi:hypothetical protein
MAALIISRVTAEVILLQTGELITERVGRWCLPTEKCGSADIGRVPVRRRVSGSIAEFMAEESPPKSMKPYR